jgi:hypothetical protein
MPAIVGSRRTLGTGTWTEVARLGGLSSGRFKVISDWHAAEGFPPDDWAGVSWGCHEQVVVGGQVPVAEGQPTILVDKILVQDAHPAARVRVDGADLVLEVNDGPREGDVPRNLMWLFGLAAIEIEAAP